MPSCSRTAAEGRSLRLFVNLPGRNTTSLDRQTPAPLWLSLAVPPTGQPVPDTRPERRPGTCLRWSAPYTGMASGAGRAGSNPAGAAPPVTGCSPQRPRASSQSCSVAIRPCDYRSQEAPGCATTLLAILMRRYSGAGSSVRSARLAEAASCLSVMAPPGVKADAEAHPVAPDRTRADDGPRVPCPRQPGGGSGSECFATISLGP